jgi:hypothetical protein
MENTSFLLFTFCCLLLLSTEITAQEPITLERYYNDSGVVEGKALQQTFDNGYIIAGRRLGQSMFSNDAILMKTDSIGDIEWIKVYGTQFDDDWFHDVKQTSDSGFIACGYYPRLGMAEDIYVVKTDKNGDTLWTKVWGSNIADWAYSIENTYDGGYVIAGVWEESTGLVCRLDASGDTLWTKKLRYATSLYSISPTLDSGFVATGVFASGAINNHQVYVVKLDKDGNIVWEWDYGYAGADWGQCIKTLADGNYIVGGLSWHPPNSYESYLLKLTDSGDTLWTKLYSDPQENGLLGLTPTADGGFALVETKFVQGLSYQAAIVRTDASGNFLWREEFGYQGQEYANAITACQDGGFAITGMSVNGTQVELFLIKTNESGLLSITKPAIEKKPLLQVRPNPFSDYLYIDLEGVEALQDLELRCYDALGRLMYQEKIIGTDTGSIYLSIGSLWPAGAYYLQIINKNQIIETIKLIHY